MSSKTCSETPSTRRRLEIPFINLQLSEKELCSKFGTHGWLCEEKFSSPPSHKGAAVTRRTLTSPGEVEKVGKADHSQGNRGRISRSCFLVLRCSSRARAPTPRLSTPAPCTAPPLEASWRAWCCHSDLTLRDAWHVVPGKRFSPSRVSLRWRRP